MCCNVLVSDVSLGSSVLALYHLLAVGMEEKAVTAVIQSK